MLKEIKVKLIGEEPLIMHRGDLADPMDPWAIQLAVQSKKAKKEKTEAEYTELYRLEWLGGIYVDDKIGVVVPTDNLIKVVIEGARREKLGKVAEAAVFVSGIAPNGHQDAVKLDFPGPQELNDMWEQSIAGTADFIYKKTIRVQNNRIVRCRPRFRTWSVMFNIRYDHTVMEKSALIRALTVAGNLIGIGDWRPRYGTFRVEIL